MPSPNSKSCHKEGEYFDFARFRRLGLLLAVIAALFQAALPTFPHKMAERSNAGGELAVFWASIGVQLEICGDAAVSTSDQKNAESSRKGRAPTHLAMDCPVCVGVNHFPGLTPPTSEILAALSNQTIEFPDRAGEAQSVSRRWAQLQPRAPPRTV